MRGAWRIIGVLILTLAFTLPKLAAQDVQAPIHTIQTGETLANIALAYGVPLDLLAQVNNITDAAYIRTGQDLIIPLEGTNYSVPQLVNGEPGAKNPGKREIVVILSQQTAYAYEDGVLVRSVTISSGAAGTPTVRGRFKVYSKIAEKTLSGRDYNYPNVQWLMYFYQGYAVHGAYWHNDFGTPVSHGCINMTNEDAMWFYNFAEIGTPVTVVND